MIDRYIQPWWEYGPLRQRTIVGTEVRYRGVTLRARGEYEHQVARALIQSHNHMAVEC